MASLDKNKKKFGFKRIISSIYNSGNGLKAAYSSEQSMYIHLVVSIVLLAFSFYFNISVIEWMFVIGIIGLTLAIELINTAIESVVDLVTKDFHPLAKIAKDTASGAEFVLTITCFIISLIIFVPKIMELF